jgi:hypothetical protein
MLILEGQPVFQKDLPGLKDANYQGRFWLKPGERRIYQAVLEIKKAAPKQAIKVKIKLWDFNQKCRGVWQYAPTFYLIKLYLRVTNSAFILAQIINLVV